MVAGSWLSDLGLINWVKFGSALLDSTLLDSLVLDSLVLDSVSVMLDLVLLFVKSIDSNLQ